MNIKDLEERLILAQKANEEAAKLLKEAHDRTELVLNTLIIEEASKIRVTKGNYKKFVTEFCECKPTCFDCPLYEIGGNCTDFTLEKQKILNDFAVKNNWKYEGKVDENNYDVYNIMLCEEYSGCLEPECPLFHGDCSVPTHENIRTLNMWLQENPENKYISKGGDYGVN